MSGSPDQVVTGVSTDTRTLKEGDLFFALQGERFDGHDFVRKAIRKGAAGVVIAQKRGRSFGRKISSGNFISVPDPLKALGSLASSWRKRFRIPVIAVTGSNGKTTTKEIIGRLLSRRYRLLKTEGNFNNLIGLPLTLFRLNRRHQVAVLEMGTNAPGEIRRLTEVASPQVGVVTNVGRAHLEGLKNPRGVAREKGALLAGLPRKGLAVINGDDSFFSFLKKRASSRVVSFGFGRGCTLRGLDIRTDGLKGMRFRALVGKKTGDFQMRALGIHNVANALAALAVGRELGVPLKEMKGALRGFSPPHMRMEPLRLGKWTLLHDGYNANPDSMERALEYLQTVPARRRVAILGEMLELGDKARRAHRRLGSHAAKGGVGLLIGVGPHSQDLKKGAVQAGIDPARVRADKDLKGLLPKIRGILREGDLILVKGSRGMEMERVVDFLKGS